MKGLKHTIELKIKSIEGIQVLDQKRDGSSKPTKKLSKVTSIVSLSRNKWTESFGSSMPLTPATHRQNADGSFRYKAAWDERDDKARTMTVDTKLHLQKKSKEGRRGKSRSRIRSVDDALHEEFEAKEFHMIVGLQRKEEFILLASSSIKIGPIKTIRVRLPLSIVGESTVDATSRNSWHKNHLFFEEDSAREFGLAPDAYIDATITCVCQELLPIENVPNTSKPIPVRDILERRDQSCQRRGILRNGNLPNQMVFPTEHLQTVAKSFQSSQAQVGGTLRKWKAGLSLGRSYSRSMSRPRGTVQRDDSSTRATKGTPKLPPRPRGRSISRMGYEQRSESRGPSGHLKRGSSREYRVRA